MVELEIAGISKRFQLHGRTIQALNDINLICPPGGFVALVGRSGCGKTTLLRTVAGFEVPDEGYVRTGEGHPRTAMVFQEPRLMPWLSVRENVGFGMKGRLSGEQLQHNIDQLLITLRLTDCGDAMPSQISGGMAQRTALGRALCMDPQVLLMDEPFGALDAFTRRALQNELIQIWRAKEEQRTILFVTHDVEEAVLLAERVLVMEAGRLIAEVGVPLPYPRKPEDAQVIALRERLIAILNETHDNAFLKRSFNVAH